MRKGAFAVALLLCAQSASCRRHKSDEELLREKVDTIPVHLYVATKIAVLRAPNDPSARAAREQLTALIDSGSRLLAYASQRDRAAPAQVETSTTIEFQPRDIARLASALWGLHAEGARVVRSDREDEMQPILPTLVTGGAQVPYWVAHIDVNTEHAVFFSALLAMRLNPRVPVPIPPEIILYEGSRIDVTRVQIPGFTSILLGARAYVYATHALCDLASRDATAMDRIEWNAAALQRGLGALSNGHTVDAAKARALDLSFRALGHGATAVCYGQRGDEAQMKEELRRFVESLHSLGVPPEETGVIRAFLAHENRDDAGARRALSEARRMQNIDAATLAQIDAMDRALASNDRGEVRRQFDRGQLAALTARVVYRQIERTGVFDAIAEQPEMLRLRAYLAATGRAADGARATAGASASQAGQRARGWFDRIRR